MQNKSTVIPADKFRNVLGHYPTGISVVTADAPEDGPVGMVVGTFSSLSLDPALVSFMPAKTSTSWPKIESAGAFCVNVLGANQGGELVRQFSAPADQKYDGVDWRPSDTGSPILDGAISWVDCRIEQVFDAGDHYIVVGRVVDLSVESDELPMTFIRGQYGQVQLPQSSSTETADEVDPESGKLAEEVAQLLGLEEFDYQAWVESRDQIVERLLIGYLEALLARFDDRVDTAETPTEQLRSLVTVSMQSLRDYAAAAIMFQSERSNLTPGSSERLKALETQFRQRWTAVIEQGVKTGSFGEVDPRMAQQFICDALFSTARWFRDGGRLERSEVEEAFTTFALNVVRP